LHEWMPYYVLARELDDGNAAGFLQRTHGFDETGGFVLR
jgi:hypothetical protein